MTITIHVSHEDIGNPNGDHPVELAIRRELSRRPSWGVFHIHLDPCYIELSSITKMQRFEASVPRRLAHALSRYQDGQSIFPMIVKLEFYPSSME